MEKKSNPAVLRQIIWASLQSKWYFYARSRVFEFPAKIKVMNHLHIYISMAISRTCPANVSPFGGKAAEQFGQASRNLSEPNLTLANVQFPNIPFVVHLKKWFTKCRTNIYVNAIFLPLLFFNFKRFSPHLISIYWNRCLSWSKVVTAAAAAAADEKRIPIV